MEIYEGLVYLLVSDCNYYFCLDKPNRIFISYPSYLIQPMDKEDVEKLIELEYSDRVLIMEKIIEKLHLYKLRVEGYLD